MNIDDLPVFVVTSIQPDSPQLKGEVSRWDWVGERYIAYLYLGEDQLVKGRFRNVNESTNSVAFAFNQPELVSEIKSGASFPFFDGYWGERAKIALDKSLEWQEIAFKPRDAIYHYPGGRKEVRPGGWDHEHCVICWAKISLSENTNFRKSSQDHKVCLDCYGNHITSRNIDFMPDA